METIGSIFIKAIVLGVMFVVIKYFVKLWGFEDIVLVLLLGLAIDNSWHRNII